MARRHTNAELSAFLDESLAPEEMAALEAKIREQPELAQRLAALHRQRDEGDHNVGDIWRRNRLSCPTREQLGSFLLDVLTKEQAAYVQFHVGTVGCRICQANLDDLRRQQEEGEKSKTRRRKYFQSSAGLLRKDRLA